MFQDNIRVRDTKVRGAAERFVVACYIFSNMIVNLKRYHFQFSTCVFFAFCEKTYKSRVNSFQIFIRDCLRISIHWQLSLKVLRQSLSKEDTIIDAVRSVELPGFFFQEILYSEF